MDAPRPTGAPLFVLSLITTLGLAGCAGTAPPAPPRPSPTPQAADTPPPPAAEPSAPSPAAPTPAPQATSEEITGATRPGQAVDVVDPGGEKGPVSLVEASRAERERRARSGPPVAVINDQNVKKSTGQITIATPKKPAAANPETAAALEALKDEQYWRSRALDIRSRLREATDRIHDLELSAAGWRRRFYAEEDPYFRDGKIKPEWDRVLARLEEQRQEIETTRKELDAFLEEGRRAGALPGWLREGGELEPAAETPKSPPGIANPSEPQIYDEPRPPYREDDAA